MSRNYKPNQYNDGAYSALFGFSCLMIFDILAVFFTTVEPKWLAIIGILLIIGAIVSIIEIALRSPLIATKKG